MKNFIASRTPQLLPARAFLPASGLGARLPHGTVPSCLDSSQECLSVGTAARHPQVGAATKPSAVSGRQADHARQNTTSFPRGFNVCLQFGPAKLPRRRRSIVQVDLQRQSISGKGLGDQSLTVASHLLSLATKDRWRPIKAFFSNRSRGPAPLTQQLGTCVITINPLRSFTAQEDYLKIVWGKDNQG